MFSEDNLFLLSIILTIVYFNMVPLYYDKDFNIKPIPFAFSIISWFIYFIISISTNFDLSKMFTLLYVAIFEFRSLSIMDKD